MDPAHNTRRDHNLANCIHEVLPDDDMKKFGKVVQYALAHGGNSILFRSSYQFLRWNQVFGAKKETQMEHDDVDRELTKTVFKHGFPVM